MEEHIYEVGARYTPGPKMHTLGQAALGLQRTNGTLTSDCLGFSGQRGHMVTSLGSARLEIDMYSRTISVRACWHVHLQGRSVGAPLFTKPGWRGSSAQVILL